METTISVGRRTGTQLGQTQQQSGDDPRICHETGESVQSGINGG